jgi:hypothetical protein
MSRIPTSYEQGERLVMLLSDVKAASQAIVTKLQQLENDVNTLKDNIYEVTYREIIDPTGTTTGSITFPPNSTLDTEDYPGNAILSTLTPTGEIAGETPLFSGSPVTATLATNGDWTTNSFTNDPVAIIFRLKIRAFDYLNLDQNKIIDFASGGGETALNPNEWVEISTTTTLLPGKYKLNASSGSFTIFLDNSANVGGEWVFSDSNQTISPNTITINDITSNFTDENGIYQSGGFIVDSKGASFVLFKSSFVNYDIIPLNAGLGNVTTYQLISEKGQNNGYTPLDSNGLVPIVHLPFTTPLVYKGSWDASTNTPTLINGIGTTGDTYIVSIAGTQNLGSGNITFSVQDIVVYNGTEWEKVGASSTSWGTITGLLSDQTDLTNVLNTKITQNGNSFGQPLVIKTLDNQPLQIGTNNISHLFLNQTGDLGIGANSHSSAILSLFSNSKGFLPPVLTQFERNSIPTPAQGLLIYSSTTNSINYFDGIEWKDAGQAFTVENAQDATGLLFSTGVHSGISYSYDDVNNKIDSTVTINLQGVLTNGNTSTISAIFTDGTNTTTINIDSISVENTTNKFTINPNSFIFEQGLDNLTLSIPVLSGNNTQTFQNASGTIALLSDIPPPGISSLTTNNVFVGDNTNNASQLPILNYNYLGRLAGDVESLSIGSFNLLPYPLTIPSFTTAERDLLTGVIAGSIIYNKTVLQFQLFNGSAWASILPESLQTDHAFIGNSLNIAESRPTANLITLKVTLVNGVFTYSNGLVTSDTIVTANATNIGTLTGFLRIETSPSFVVIRSVDSSNATIITDNAQLNVMIFI